MKNVIDFCTEYLKLEKPIRITIYTANNKNNLCGESTIVEGKNGIKYHQITLLLPSIYNSGYTLQGILVHELIHSWQFEYQKGYMESLEYHGKPFRDKARNLWRAYKRRFPNTKVAWKEIYNRKSDIE
jgi:hypothetical protein